jgi:hypothetical protein
MKKKTFIIFTICFFCVWGCEEFLRRKLGGLAGSYPFVESWEINAPEREVLEAIIILKKQMPELQPPSIKMLIGKRDTTYGWKSDSLFIDYVIKLETDSLAIAPIDSNKITTDYWLHVAFYYKETNEIVYTWTRPDVMDSSKTTLALIGFSIADDSTDYRLINRDFWYLANKMQIHKFKKTILQPILDKIKEKSYKTQHITKNWH